MNNEQAQLLKKFINNESINELCELKLVLGCTACIIYPTNDLWLSEKQYAVLLDFLKKIGENEFYLTQFDGASVQDSKNFCSIFSETNPVYKLEIDRPYETYNSLPLYSVSVLFSVMGTWAIFIDETFDAGYGIFVSSRDLVDKFIALYKSVKAEFSVLMNDKQYKDHIAYYKDLLIVKDCISSDDLIE